MLLDLGFLLPGRFYARFAFVSQRNNLETGDQERTEYQPAK